MGGYLVLYFFYLMVVSALFRPVWGIFAFYGWILLQPNWNWRWIIPATQSIQTPLFVATLIGFVLTGFRGNRLRGVPLVSVLSFATFLFLAYLSTLTSIEPVTSAKYFDALWKIGLASLLLTVLLDTPSKILAFLWIAILGQGYNAYQINLSYYEDGFCRYVYGGTWGYQGDNNIYSNLTVSILFISSSLSFFATKLWHRVLAGFIALLQAHQIMMMESRGAMLAGLLALGLWFFFIPKNYKTMLGFAMLAILGSALAGPSVVQEFMSSFKTESEIDLSAASRYDLWNAGVIITFDNPAFGVGPNCARYLVPSLIGIGESVSNKSLHNLFLEISAGCGIPAFIFYLSFFLFPAITLFWQLFFHSRKLPRWLQGTYLACLTGMFAFMLGSMFSAAAQLESSYILVAVANAAQLVYARQLRESAAFLDTETVVEKRVGYAHAQPFNYPQVGHEVQIPSGYQ
jgi:O-antigen ligase